jgi:acetyl esterase/lipase
MASKQSAAVTRHYQANVAAFAENPQWTLQESQDFSEGWNVLTTEPGGVDYLEVSAGGVPAMWAVPKGAQDSRVLLSLHGGGFVGGSMYSHRKLFAHVAKQVGARALIVNYRLLPEGRYPAPLDDAYAAYRWLLDQGIEARHIAFIGDSAGGTLSIGAQLRARADGLPLAAATMLISPWTDMTVTGETMLSNSEKDALFNLAWVKDLVAGFLDGTDPRNPLASPLHADLTGFGPVYIQVGDHEMLLDDSRRFAERAEKAGLDVRIDVFPEMQHTFQMMAGRAPEADDAVARLADWARSRLGLYDC